MIKQLTKDEVKYIVPLAMEFGRSCQFFTIDPEYWQNLWEGIVERGQGIVFADEEYCGTIAVIISRDLFCGDLQATEGFWFVTEGKRGTPLAMRLFSMFEQQAKFLGCKRIKMAHMCDSFPEKLEKIYQKKGYKRSEIHYLKEVENG